MENDDIWGQKEENSEDWFSVLIPALILEDIGVHVKNPSTLLSSIMG